MSRFLRRRRTDYRSSTARGNMSDSRWAVARGSVIAQVAVEGANLEREPRVGQCLEFSVKGDRSGVPGRGNAEIVP